jgi:hypothetical protein
LTYPENINDKDDDEDNDDEDNDDEIANVKNIYFSGLEIDKVDQAFEIADDDEPEEEITFDAKKEQYSLKVIVPSKPIISDLPLKNKLEFSEQYIYFTV